MGTRSITAVFSNGEYKIAHYGRWDGYPSGNGSIVLSFLSVPNNIVILKASLSRIKLLDIDTEKDRKFYNDHLNNAQKRRDLSYISESIGAEILQTVISSKDSKIYLESSLAAVKNSCWCDYAYIIDFDKHALEVYIGLNKKLLDNSERFAEFEQASAKYHPVKFLHSFPLNDLPRDNEFLEVLKKRIKLITHTGE